MLKDLLERQCLGGDCDEWLDAAGNARLVAGAEAYYRSIFNADEDSWNHRDTHMYETLCQLLEEKPNEKAVVWAHNSHIGDARATEMDSRAGRAQHRSARQAAVRG